MNNSEKKQANLILILAVILAILLTSLVWWFFSKPAKPIVTKGDFTAVKIKPSEVKQLPQIKYVHDGVKTIVDSTGVIIFRSLYNLTKAENDSLLAVNSKLDSLAQVTNDKYFQELYNNCKFVEFSHKFEKDTLGLGLNATVSGITRGAPERLKLTYDLKLPKPKETVFVLWGGVEAGMRKSFDNFNTKVNLDFQFGKNTIVKISFDSEQRIYLGINKSIFIIKK